MTNTLLDVSGKIDPSRLGVIELVHGACARLEIPLMLVGALARDIHFSLANEIHPRRTTMDVDFAVLVEDWAKFDRLTGSLTKIAGISQSAGQPHRFTGANRMEFDVIPFGEVENPAGRIAWPPDYGSIMSTVGFTDALESSVLCRLRIDPVLEIRIVSIPGLAMLKLISWRDGYPNRTKDAQDLLFILQHYLDTGRKTDSTRATLWTLRILTTNAPARNCSGGISRK